MPTATSASVQIGEQTRHQIESVREFNRFYTRLIGALNRGFLESPFSLAEVRVLLELYYRKNTTASVIGQADSSVESGHPSVPPPEATAHRIRDAT